MHSGLHLHLGHHELDVVFVLGQVGEDLVFIDSDNLLGHLLDLFLGEVLAVGHTLVKIEQNSGHVGLEVNDVGIVSTVEAIDSTIDLFRELRSDTDRQVIGVVHIDEGLDHTGYGSSEALLI